MARVLPEITANFFYDEKIILSLGNRIEEAKGHVILLHEDNDISLRLGALLEGSTIDFLFGSKGIRNSNEKIKAERVKDYIKSLKQSQQVIISIFYCKLYRAIISYHIALEGSVINMLSISGECYCCTSSLRKELFDKIGEAYSQVNIHD
jgi:hypothetical protein